MAEVAEIAAGLMRDSENSAIVLSGCGTSGRIGFIVARAFNQLLVRCMACSAVAFRRVTCHHDIEHRWNHAVVV